MASTPRKEDKPTRPPSRIADTTNRGLGPAEPATPPKLSPEWLASMLLDVTAHLMNAIDRAARLGVPLERIAVAAEAGADAAEAEQGRRALAAHRSRRRIIVVALMAVLAIAMIVPIARYTSLISRVQGEVYSYETPAGTHLFVLGGARYEATRAQFEQRLKQIDPEAIHKYWVAIGGKRFPVKQAVAIGLGAERATFSSSQAISILRKLGYSPQETAS